MIRKAVVSDASRIAEILIFAKRMAYSDIFNDYKVSFGEMQVLPYALEYINNISLLENVFLYDDEVVKGMIKFSFNTSQNYLEIKELYIDPFFQKNNIGSKLLEFSYEYAKNLSISDIILWVLEKNINARKFYEKNSFTITSDKKLEKGTNEYILKYEKCGLVD